MARREHLYELISTLSPSEKRHFRAQFPGREPDHLRLFNLLEKAKSYPAEGIAKTFPDHSPHRLSQLKKHTQDLLLDYLLSVQDRGRPEQKVKDLLAKASLYQDRGLSARAIQLFERTMKLCRKMHDDRTLLEAMMRLRSLLGRWKGKKPMMGIEELLQEGVEVSARIHEMSRLRELHYAFHRRVVVQGAISREETDWLDGKINESWFKSAMQSPNPRHQMICNSILAQRATFTEHREKAYEHWSRASEMAAQIELATYADQNNQISVLTNRINAAVQCRYYQLMPVLVEELRQVECLDPTAQSRKVESLHNTSLHYYNMTGSDMSEGELESMMEVIERGKINPAFRLSILLGVAVYHFIQGQLDMAARLLERFLNDPVTARLQQHRVFAETIRIILYWEQDELDLLESAVRRRVRALREQSFSFEFEKLIVEFLPILVKSPVSERRKIYRELHDKLNVIQDSERFDLYFDFTVWCGSKLGSHSFKEGLQQKLLPEIEQGQG